MKGNMRMLKNIILVQGDLDGQFDTYEEVVKELIDENFYNMSNAERKEKMKMKALANCINNRKEIVDDVANFQNINLDKTFIIKDETTYVLSLLITNNVMMFERKGADIFTKRLKKDVFKDNYIIVNTFAKALLYDYLKNT